VKVWDEIEVETNKETGDVKSCIRTEYQINQVQIIILRDEGEILFPSVTTVNDKESK
jgi:hypothetical protein